MKAKTIVLLAGVAAVFATPFVFQARDQHPWYTPAYARWNAVGILIFTAGMFMVATVLLVSIMRGDDELA